MLKILKYIIFNLSIKNIKLLWKVYFSKAHIFHRGFFFAQGVIFFAHHCIIKDKEKAKNML